MRGRIGAGVLLVLFASPSAAAEGDEEGELKQLDIALTSTKIDYNATKGTARITLAGRAKGVLPDVKLEIRLEYHFYEVGKCLASVGTDATFRNVVLEPDMPLPPDKGYDLMVALKPDVQAPQLKERVEKLIEEVQYNPRLAPVELGTAAQQKKANAELITFVKKLLKDAIALNNEMVDEHEAAEKKLKYESAGSLDTAAWREFMDKNWRPRMIKLQRSFRAWKKQNPAYAYRHAAGVLHLEEFLKVVALRSVILSKELYSRNRLKIAMEDTTFPGDFAANPRRTIKKDTSAKSFLVTCYKIVNDDFKLNPPKKTTPKKKASSPPKKGPAKKKATSKKKAAD
jgi:hypothetical protein